MSRPLRLEFPGALYHVTARGDRRAPIFRNDNDRYAWMAVLEKVCARCNLIVHAYCQMGNHYHLMLETVEGNLSQGMGQLNGAYTQNFNRRHGLVGHVLQGRYKAILVQKESYLLELARYVVLNPVRAGMVASPRDWKWSSYRAIVGDAKKPEWLTNDWILSHFGATPEQAVARYREFVLAGIGGANPLTCVTNQTLLGDEDFVAQYKGACSEDILGGVTKQQRKIHVLPLQQYLQRYPERNEAMARAYWTTAFTMKEIAKQFGVSSATVSKAVKAFSVQAQSWSSLDTDGLV